MTGADSIHDMSILGHGTISRTFGYFGVRGLNAAAATVIRNTTMPTDATKSKKTIRAATLHPSLDSGS